MGTAAERSGVGREVTGGFGQRRTLGTATTPPRREDETSTVRTTGEAKVAPAERLAGHVGATPPTCEDGNEPLRRVGPGTGIARQSLGSDGRCR